MSLGGQQTTRERQRLPNDTKSDIEQSTQFADDNLEVDICRK